MKRVLKWLGIVLGSIALILVGLALYIQFSGMPTYDVQKINVVVDKSPERVAHGRSLAINLCKLCHMNPKTGALTGQQMLDMPPEFGTAFSKNITNSKEHGIGNWTDGEILWLLRTGVHPHTSKYIPPWMPKFVHMSDYDIQSIVAFLRSDDPLVAPSSQINTEGEPTFLAKALVFGVFKPFDYPQKPIPHPDTNNALVYGKYLANAVYDCYGCHLNDFADLNQLEPENSKGFYGGGIEMADATGTIVRTANITPDNATGIGKWTKDQFINAMRTGVKPNGKVFRYPMMRIATLSDHALGGIYDYLRTVPAISKTVDKTYALSIPSNASKGEKLYYKYGCVACHGSTGMGMANLQTANAKYPEDATMEDVIRHPYKYNPDTYMPEWDSVIDPQHYPDLIAHVRKLGK